MDLELFKDFLFADESFKTVGLIILWQMRAEMKATKEEIKLMKDAIKDVTERMASHEAKQDERWNNHETRLIKVESKMVE